jgi:hypothetical protein
MIVKPEDEALTVGAIGSIPGDFAGSNVTPGQ